MVPFFAQIACGGCGKCERNIVQKTWAKVVSYGRRYWSERFGFNWVLVEVLCGGSVLTAAGHVWRGQSPRGWAR